MGSGVQVAERILFMEDEDWKKPEPDDESEFSRSKKGSRSEQR